MKTLLSILAGGEVSPKISIRSLGLFLVYLLGISVMILQLRSVL